MKDFTTRITAYLVNGARWVRSY